ncbi:MULTISPECIES: SDR family oxidoreductase [Bacillaceae]|uniref:SDR family oxidoreductase n=1 Tax=Evansella alkalicola TaxID=745819 RepID=A0ABS6JSD9_9BACI|nr:MULTISPECIES: SDR family oxidoreductase [Bacillaceae]MBU9721483.1 SDR family oxidoreductase [Bacillus alkalicola]
MKEKPVVVITGASRGIGENTAHFFASRGYIVIGTGRDLKKLKEVESRLNRESNEHKTLTMDVTNPTEIEEVIDFIINFYGRIDVWINNAGAFKAIGPTWEVDPEDWKNDVNTNLFGTFNCIHKIVPVMLAQGVGTIINVVGGGTIGSFKYGNGYGTSKTAVARFSENLALELENTPLKVFVLHPGLNDTDMTRYQRETEVGKTYLSHMEGLFEKGVHVKPEVAPTWLYDLASGTFDDYIGRIVSVTDDREELLKQNVSESDAYRLRLKK